MKTNTVTVKTATQRKYFIVRMIAVAFSALLAVLWLLPVCKIYGESVTMYEAMRMSGDKEAAAGALALLIVMSAFPVLWSLIPKLWASIVNILGALIPFVYNIVQVRDWGSKNLDLTFFAYLLIPVSLVLFVASIVALVFAVKVRKEKKAATVSAGNAALASASALA